LITFGFIVCLLLLLLLLLYIDSIKSCSPHVANKYNKAAKHFQQMLQNIQANAAKHVQQMLQNIQTHAAKHVQKMLQNIQTHAAKHVQKMLQNIQTHAAKHVQQMLQDIQTPQSNDAAMNAERHQQRNIKHAHCQPSMFKTLQSIPHSPHPTLGALQLPGALQH
jgi:t-SNARE complex subunit (syntaxin)